MYIEYNTNPKNRKVGDCVIRALSTLLDRPWDSVFWDVAAEAYIQKDTMDQSSVWGKVLANHGYKRNIIPNTCPDCYTVVDFCRDHPEGEYLLGIPGGNAHVVAVRDGNYIDTWDSGSMVPLFYYGKEDKHELQRFPGHL